MYVFNNIITFSVSSRIAIFINNLYLWPIITIASLRYIWFIIVIKCHAHIYIGYRIGKFFKFIKVFFFPFYEFSSFSNNIILIFHNTYFQLVIK